MPSLEEEIARFEPDEQSVFAEQLRQLGARPLPIAYGLLARIESPKATGWFWTGKAMDGCLVSVKRIAQKAGLMLAEAPSCRQWRVSLLTDLDAHVVFDHGHARSGAAAHAQGGAAGLEGFENPLPPGLKRRLLVYSVGPGRQEYRLKRGASHHTCEICLLPGFLEKMAATLGVGCGELERALGRVHTVDDELQLRNTVSSFQVSRMRLPGAALYLQGYVYRALADLFDYALRGGAEQADPARLSDTEMAEFVKASFSDDMARPLRLDELAVSLHVSKTKLCEAFARSEKKTIGAYLLDAKVAAAKELLADSDATIAQIAAELGFAYQNNFSAMFKRATGQTPREWRTSNRRAM